MSCINFDFSNKANKAEPMPATITIPLDLPDVRVLDTEINDKGEIIITVESTLEGATCQHCGEEINAFHQHGEWITIRHLSILGRPTYIRLRPKRYNCVRCARRKGKKKVTTTQQLSWHQAESPYSRPYEEHVLLQLVNSTIEDVRVKEGLGYDAVEGIVARNISTKVDWGQLESLEVLGIDEIALKKGHRDYVTLITARLGDGRLKILTVLPNRKKKTVKKFLRFIPKRLRETIQTVCLDMWQHYIDAVKEVFGDEVQITADRYHVAKKYRAAADKLRKKELRRLKKELSEEAYKELKGNMWTFRKNKAELSHQETELLERLFAYSPDLEKAYNLREDLTAIFEQPLSKEEATEEIKAWRKQVEESGLTCFDDFLTTLDNHFDYITNYFVKRESSGFVEGFNNKVKVIKRRCYGILNTGHLFQRIFLDLEGYRLFAGVGS
jgi:transposase